MGKLKVLEEEDTNNKTSAMRFREKPGTHTGTVVKYLFRVSTQQLIYMWFQGIWAASPMPGRT